MERRRDPDLEYLHRAIRSVRWRRVHDIQEGVATLVQALGGIDIIKKRFHSRRALDDALDGVEIGETLSKRNFPNQNPGKFVFSYDVVPAKSDGETSESDPVTIQDHVRVAIYGALRKEFLRTVFPRSRHI